MNLRPYIESTQLSPTVLGKEIDTLVANALVHNLLGVCVPPFWVKRAWREIAGRDLKLVTVVGFPLGFQMTEAKILETELAIRDGVDELDLVFHHTSFANNYPWTKIELAKISKIVHNSGKLLKVIIEAHLWRRVELERIVKLCVDTGADFIKTSTGVGAPACTPELIEILRVYVPDAVGIKASGGISNRHLAEQIVSAGADRIGSSKAEKLVLEDG